MKPIGQKVQTGKELRAAFLQFSLQSHSLVRDFTHNFPRKFETRVERPSNTDSDAPGAGMVEDVNIRHTDRNGVRKRWGKYKQCIVQRTKMREAEDEYENGREEVVGSWKRNCCCILWDSQQ